MSSSVSSSPSYELGSVSLLSNFTDEETGSEELSNLSEVTQCGAGIQTQGPDLRNGPLSCQFSHPYMTTGKTIALIRWTFVGKVMSLLFNMLSGL